MPLVYLIKQTSEHPTAKRKSTRTLILAKYTAYRLFKSTKAVRAIAAYKGRIEQRAELIVAEAVKIHGATHKVALCLAPRRHHGEVYKRQWHK